MANPQLSQPAQSPGEYAPDSLSSWILLKLELKCVVQQNPYLCGHIPWGLLPVHEALAFCGFTKSSLDRHTCGPVGLMGPRDGDRLVQGLRMWSQDSVPGPFKCILVCHLHSLKGRDHSEDTVLKVKVARYLVPRP